MPSRISAVIFDMDGVLIDAKEWHFQSLNRALKLFGCEISRYDHLVTYDGLPTRRKLEMLSIERGLPVALHGILNELKQRYTLEMIYSECRPTFHHQYALSKLKKRGLKLALCSNSIRQTVDQMLIRANLQRFFDVTLSNEEVDKAKPNPEIYLAAMSRLGVEPRQCVVVEDNPNGVRAAADAGSHVLVVDSVVDVTYDRVDRFIAQLESAHG